MAAAEEFSNEGLENVAKFLNYKKADMTRFQKNKGWRKTEIEQKIVPQLRKYAALDMNLKSFLVKNGWTEDGKNPEADLVLKAWEKFLPYKSKCLFRNNFYLDII